MNPWQSTVSLSNALQMMTPNSDNCAPEPIKLRYTTRRSTWADVERGTTLSNEFRQAFFDRVSRFSQDPVFRNMVEAEGIAMGVPAAEREQLWLGIRQLSRGGNYNIWTGTWTIHTDIAAGILRIRFQRPGGHVGTRSYAWSLLQVESLLDAGAGWSNASKEMFRIPIRQALASFRAN